MKKNIYIFALLLSMHSVMGATSDQPTSDPSPSVAPQTQQPASNPSVAPQTQQPVSPDCTKILGEIANNLKIADGLLSTYEGLYYFQNLPIERGLTIERVKKYIKTEKDIVKKTAEEEFKKLISPSIPEKNEEFKKTLDILKSEYTNATSTGCQNATYADSHKKLMDLIQTLKSSMVTIYPKIQSNFSNVVNYCKQYQETLPTIQNKNKLIKRINSLVNDFSNFYRDKYCNKTSWVWYGSTPVYIAKNGPRLDDCPVNGDFSLANKGEGDSLKKVLKDWSKTRYNEFVQKIQAEAKSLGLEKLLPQDFSNQLPEIPKNNNNNEFKTWWASYAKERTDVSLTYWRSMFPMLSDKRSVQDQYDSHSNFIGPIKIERLNSLIQQTAPILEIIKKIAAEASVAKQ